MSVKKQDEAKTHEIEELQFRIRNATKVIESVVQREDAVILVGNTKAGKSTLINYLMGNKLKTVKSKRHKFNLVKADNSLGPEISADPVSTTDNPTRFKSEVLNLVFYDVPGFSDNSSKWREIKHSVYICELLKHLASVKIILIISWDDLVNDDVSSLLRSFNGLENLFGDELRKCFAGVGLIVSKLEESIQTDRQDISEILRGQLLSNEKLDLSPAVKDFVRYFANNSQKIGMFKRRSSQIVELGDVESCIVSVINNIYRISEDTLVRLTPNVSEASSAFLFELREKLYDQEKFIQMQELVASYLKSEYVPSKDIGAQTMREAKQSLDNLTILKIKIEEYLTKWPRFCDKVNAAKKLDPSISDCIEKNDLYEKVKCTETIDRILKNEESRYLDVYLKRICTEANKEIETNLVSVNVRLGKVSEEEAKQKFEAILKNFHDDRRKVEKEIERLNEFVRAKKEYQRRTMRQPRFPVYFRTQF